MMRISIVGSGYVGLVSGAGLSEVGHHVVCMDIDEVRIENLHKGIVPIFEPGLENMLHENMQQGRLKFTSSMQDALDRVQVLIIAVGTPPDEDGSADLSHVLAVARSVAEAHHGSLHLDATATQGATFVLRLPLDNQPDRRISNDIRRLTAPLSAQTQAEEAAV